MADRGDLITSKINLHQGAVALAPRRLVCSTHYQIYRTKTPDCTNDYLCHILRSPQFLAQLAEQKNKGIKNEQGSAFIQDFEVPLPPAEVQETIARNCNARMAVIQACRTIQTESALELPLFSPENLRPLREAVLETRNGWSPVCNGGDTPVLTLSCLKRGRIDLTQRKYTSAIRKDIAAFYVREGDFFYSRGNTPELVALAGIAGPAEEQVVFPDLLTRVVFNSLILPEFSAILFNSTYGRAYFSKVPQGASPTMVKVSQEYMGEFLVPFLGDIASQEQVIEAARAHFAVLEAMDRLQNDAKDQIQRTLAETWG